MSILTHRSSSPLSSSGIELVNAAALLLLFTLSFMLIGRQQRLRRTEMVHRLNSIINQLNGERKGGMAQEGDGMRVDSWRFKWRENVKQ